jgi:hypothetical protein
MPVLRISAWLGVGQVFQDFGGVALGFDGRPDRCNVASFADKERASHDAHESPSHDLLLLPRAVGFDGLVAGIAEQRKIEPIFGLEQGLRLDGIGAHAQDGHVELFELLFCVAKLGRFDDSTGSVGFGEEEQQNALPGEVFERDRVVFVRLQAERRCLVAGIEHGSPRDILTGQVDCGMGAML